MTIRMDLNDATFKATDVIKMITGVIALTVFAITIHVNLGNLKESVGDIRATQIDNSRKNDLRWEAITIEINQLKLNQSLLDQRIKALEARN